MISNSAQRVEAIATSADLDAVLLEGPDGPLGREGNGNQTGRDETGFKKKPTNVIMYSEIYEPLLVGEKSAESSVSATTSSTRATNQQIMSTGSVSAEEFIHKRKPGGTGRFAGDRERT